MRRGSILILAGLFTIAAFSGIRPRPLLGKDLRQVGLLESMIFSIVPKDKGSVLKFTWPGYIGSRSFRNGRVYSFMIRYEVDSWETLLDVMCGIYRFHELGMQVYPENSPQMTVTAVKDASGRQKLHADFNVELFEGREEPGVESFSLWERPFDLEMRVYDESEFLHVIALARKFKHPSAALDLENGFSISITPLIDPDGREYLRGRLSLHYIPVTEPASQVKHSEWDIEGRLRLALQYVLKIPRLKKGLTPAGRDESISLWFQELRSEQQPDGSTNWYIQGLAWNPKNVTAFAKDLRASGNFEDVRIDSLTTNYLPGCDILLSNFRMTLSIP